MTPQMTVQDHERD